MLSLPVRLALRVFALFALAVAIALAGRYGSSYVVFVVPPWRIELSLMVFVIIAIGLFAIIHFAWRFTRYTIRLPDEIRSTQATRAREKARDALIESQRALFSGQFIEAEAKAKQAMRHDQTRDLAHASAAWAAYEGGKYAAALPYLEQITEAAGAAMRDASKAYMLLNDGKADEALPILRQLAEVDPKNPGVLKMKIEAEIAEKAWQDVLDTLTPLMRSGLLPESAAQQIRINAELNLLKTRALDSETLLNHWKALPPASRYDSGIAVTVAGKLIQLGAGQDAQEVIEQAIDKRGEQDWDESLVYVYADCKGDSTLAQIERAEKWLRTHARDAALLLTLGKLCMRQALWGKAQSYLEASVALSPSLDAHLTLARLMERIGKHEQALFHIQQAAEWPK